MTNNGTLNYNLTLEKPPYMLSKENYTKYINERNKFDPTYPDSNDNRFDTPQYSYSILETSLYRVEDSSGELTLVGSVYYPKTGNLVKFENGQAIELKEPVTGNKVPLNSIKKLIPGIEYEFVPLPPDYSKKYLTFEVVESGTITIVASTGAARTISYSMDNGNTWTDLTTSNTFQNLGGGTLNVGDKILVKGNNSSYTTVSGYNTYYNYFGGTAKVKLYGNIMSLVSGDNFANANTLSGVYTFYNLFSGFSNKLLSIENLVLPAINLQLSCYCGMFKNCSSITIVPELPATILKEHCYESMFKECKSLITPPILPATTMVDYCYASMFQDCTSLVTAPELPATTLAGSCYSSMFYGCKNLTTTPELPATTMSSYCYYYMFNNCTSLTTALELPATTLARSCYANMFQGCTGLTTVPELPATTLTQSCYQLMFKGCTNLNYIKAMFITTPSDNYTYEWVSGVAATGTFVKNPDALWSVTGVNGVPSGWTVETA